MSTQPLTTEQLEQLSKFDWGRIEKIISEDRCDYWRSWTGCKGIKKNVYISRWNYLYYRCIKHRSNFQKLTQKEVFYLKCQQQQN